MLCSFDVFARTARLKVDEYGRLDVQRAHIMCHGLPQRRGVSEHPRDTEEILRPTTNAW